ncbi:hypothetical protein OHA71_23590 [Streptomyces sp. NBC_00444]|uniref:hypothetical protein n=1 Tax=Streptomyces sp. NBC_00444 TaxID=2975744 RepID=UPI002E1AF627
MTAPAPARIPTPGDIAARGQAPKPTPPRARTAPGRPAAESGERKPYEPQKLTAEQAIAPGKLTKKEHFRKYFLFGLRGSRMPPHARLVGHDLMWRASHATGQMSPNLQPTVEALAHATGLTTGQVDVALQVLHTRGWLHYRRLQEGARAGQKAMVLAIPAAALEQIRAQDKRPRGDLSR